MTLCIDILRVSITQSNIATNLAEWCWFSEMDILLTLSTIDLCWYIINQAWNLFTFLKSNIKLSLEKLFTMRGLSDLISPPIPRSGRFGDWERVEEDPCYLSVCHVPVRASSSSVLRSGLRSDVRLLCEDRRSVRWGEVRWGEGSQLVTVRRW